MNQSGSSPKRLIIHWDINGTITAVDTTERGSPIENANMVISKSVFGKVVDSEWQLNDPDIHDATESQTYYDYLKSIDPVHYKKRSFVFTEPDSPGHRLAHMVDSVVKSSETFLFDSFLKAVERYPEALHLIRTFGQDTKDVLDTLRKNAVLGKFFENVSTGQPLSIENIEVDGKILTFDEFNSYLTTTDRHIMIQENYDYWNTNGRKKEYGKQLLGHPDLFQIFFDDNDCVNLSEEPHTKFVLVNTLAALLDTEYYVRLIDVNLKK